MTEQNTLRRLNKLWKDRHTHDETVATQSDLLILKETVERQADSVSPSIGAYIHLVRSTTQSMSDGGEAVSWEAFKAEAERLTFAQPSFATTDITIPEPGYYDVGFEFDWDTYTGGGSVWISRTRDGTETTIYPTGSVTTNVWTATYGTGGDFIGKAIPCEVGDILKVYVDGQSGSAETLAAASVAVELIDAGRVAEAVAFPSIRDTDSATFSGTDNIPVATAVAGDLLLVLGNTDGSGTLTTPSGYTLIDSETTGDAKAYLFGRVATGSDAATSTVSSGDASFAAVSIKDWFGELSGVETGTWTEHPSGTSSDPAPLSPSWGSENTLWLIGASANVIGAEALTDWSTGFTEAVNQNQDGAIAALAWRQEETATQNPDTITWSGTPTNIKDVTIGVRR